MPADLGRFYAMTTHPVPLGDPIWDEISVALREHYPNMCICWIDKVINDKVQYAYEEKKEAIREHRESVKEIRVFHGTKHAYVSNIVKYGFMVDRNITSAFGKGTYFSNEAKMCSSYTNLDRGELSYMFVCKLLVGKVKLGSNNEKHDGTYDNTVNNIDKPTIWTTPYDNGAFPQFLVAFHKNAK